VVRARKMDFRKKSGCVFCIPDVEEWLETEAPHAGPFVLPQPLPEEPASREEAE